MAEPTKAEQLRALIEQLRQALQIAAGGVDPNVQAVVEEMEAVLRPSEPA